MDEHQVKSLPAPLKLELLDVCSSQIPETKSLSLQASHQQPWGAVGAELILVLFQGLAEIISHPGRPPGQVIQMCHGADSRVLVPAVGSHLTAHCVPQPMLLPLSIPTGLSLCTPQGFLQTLSSLFPGTLSSFLHCQGLSGPLHCSCQFQESCSAVSSFGWSFQT